MVSCFCTFYPQNLCNSTLSLKMGTIGERDTSTLLEFCSCILSKSYYQSVVCYWPSVRSSLGASSPGDSVDGAEKGRRACIYVSRIWISASKSRCEMLIGGDDISNDIINLGSCFTMFVYKQAFPHQTQDHAYENMWGEIWQPAKHHHHAFKTCLSSRYYSCTTVKNRHYLTRIPTCFCFPLIGGNLTAQLTRSHRGIRGGIQIPEM